MGVRVFGHYEVQDLNLCVPDRSLWLCHKTNFAAAAWGSRHRVSSAWPEANAAIGDTSSSGN